MKAATCKSFIVALVVAAAVDVVHKPAVTTYCHAGRRCRGGQDKRCWADKSCAKADNPFDAPRAAHVRPAVLADAAYYVGYAGLSTFDRTLVDVRATRDQWDARLARPDNCTFTVGKNKQRGVADHVPNAPAGRVYMRHFRSLP